MSDVVLSEIRLLATDESLQEEVTELAGTDLSLLVLFTVAFFCKFLSTFASKDEDGLGGRIFAIG